VLDARALRGGEIGKSFTAGRNASGYLGETEIENFGGAALGDEDVCGLMSR
jgi:hypothetical protein